MPNSKQNPLDPALDSMKDFFKASKKSASAILKMRQDIIFSEGILSSKIKAAMALVWSISAKCDPCLKYYAVKAKEMGLTEEELGELLAVGSTMGGCVGEMWCLKAYHAFKHADELTEACCEVH
ncbi:MAG: carboxymuconolactone decarboxylase family protein [Chlamydiia bacterium]|nr:carboxymuconolactone decarboxylase family protein [Chlamydiia bacterium]